MGTESGDPADTGETRWSLLDAAGAGDADARSTFAAVYLPVVRAFLMARWRDGRARAAVEDAAQDVFVECLRPGGALSRVDPEKPGRFRTYLFAVVRNVCRRHEERWRKEAERNPAGAPAPSQMMAADDDHASQVFDRAWAVALLRRAAARQRRAATLAGERALRRVELLDLRFREGLPIREIARRWQDDPAHLHREYAAAREEFKGALIDELACRWRELGHELERPQLERECEDLLGLLG